MKQILQLDGNFIAAKLIRAEPKDLATFNF